MAPSARTVDSTVAYGFLAGKEGKGTILDSFAGTSLRTARPAGQETEETGPFKVVCGIPR
jgi:hypothetical protein